MKGRTLVNAAFTGDFLAGMAARACTERDESGKRVIDGQAVTEMPLGDFQAITRKARGFLLRAGSQQAGRGSKSNVSSLQDTTAGPR